ncbi:TPA: hypothetical protein VIT54_001861 [Streptococcus pyogenes]|nr:hypothetical protein [Streptococcus pyogenes]HER6536685.1 hypothetical protein [Streptococcus pyogenes]
MTSNSKAYDNQKSNDLISERLSKNCFNAPSSIISPTIDNKKENNRPGCWSSFFVSITAENIDKIINKNTNNNSIGRENV